MDGLKLLIGAILVTGILLNSQSTWFKLLCVLIYAVGILIQLYQRHKKKAQ